VCSLAAAGAAAAEPLHAHPANARVVVFRGRPTLLVGSTEHYGAVLNPDFDYRRYLDTVAAAAAAEPGPALERAARELLALQSSDWAFQVTHQLADDYPFRRVHGHSRELDAALEAVKDSAPVPEATLRNLAPELDLSALLTP